MCQAPSAQREVAASRANSDRNVCESCGLCAMGTEKQVKGRWGVMWGWGCHLFKEAWKRPQVGLVSTSSPLWHPDGDGEMRK